MGNLVRLTAAALWGTTLTLATPSSPDLLHWSRDVSSYNSSTYNSSSSYNSSGLPGSALFWKPGDCLPQDVTNGQSTFGTLGHSPLGAWADGPLPNGTPWGNRKANNTNPYVAKNVPNTGVTRYYSWSVTNTTLAPDGVSLPLLVVNNQFPGPLIEANWGDWIQVDVTNNLDEGTALHWHGFLQTGTPWADGVPGVGHCPIVAPGKSFTYLFRAELYGSSWWHSHYSAQYINGMSGPIVIHGPKTDDYDVDLGPVLLSDWFHGRYIDLVSTVFVASEFGPIFPPMANNMLINGKANFDCKNTNQTCSPDAGLAEFRFTSGKRHLLRLINHSAEAIIFFSIDGYNLKVIANDFVPLEPYDTDLVVLGVGQRTDIIVEAIGNSTDSVWMRITEGPSGLGPAGETGCSLNTGTNVETTAAIYYEKADTSIQPNTTNPIDPSRLLFPLNCNNQPLADTVPAYAMAVPEPSVTFNFTITSTYNSSGDFVWLMNNRTYYADYNDPTLLEAKLGNLDFPEKSVVYDLGTNTSVRVIMQSVGFPASHPMHWHGHNMYILAEGLGTWDGVTITNPSNPQRRDTQLIQPGGYLVVQVDLENPGVWPFHCHIAWHISEGMNINFLEQTPYVIDDLQIPYSVAQTCRDWSDWTGKNVVEQIDSGL